MDEKKHFEICETSFSTRILTIENNPSELRILRYCRECGLLEIAYIEDTKQQWHTLIPGVEVEKEKIAAEK